MSDRLLSTFPLPAPTLSALARAGYETSSDLSSLTPEQLSKDLNIPLPASQAVFSATRPTAAPPMTQSAAAMMGTTTQYSTACAPLDRLLGGGLKRGHILEINGPPGSGKEQIAANAVTSFVDANQEVLFVDMQNMVLPATIKRILMAERPTADAGGMALVRYHTLHTTAELVVFLRTLPAYLAARPATGLLVLNSLPFPFQVKQDYKDRNAILDLLRQVLMRACASMGLTVIITSQLVSKSCQRDGESGSAPLGSKYTMIPSFGAAQFPSGKTYRVILVPKTRTTGDMRLLSSPTHVPSAHALREEPYQRVRGAIA
ncbi:P-loop containing nucleoside triphosphate hydrolase protein [Trametes versicolor FP-101664 SS1]|uniref:P-loop containing nucleoside triphosphate hydrolase protein n=1 Tax=Trametes versicolor (strain FP-101664) TaxID=717944 RepID=UPI0004622575|nr:P-loop containing nucleoside triphosphate hydrolase protein [Trametes versicolor FP-101664 SS1]EIW55006.1 P-loop containing nucleoside triphosphate hydrolase protein [Trametes versicolor FP-101664 SS1]